MKLSIMTERFVLFFASLTLFATISHQRPDLKNVLPSGKNETETESDPKHRAVHQYRSVCNGDGTCTYIFTLTVPAKLGGKIFPPNLNEISGTTLRSDEEIEEFKKQLFSIHSQLMNLTQNSAADSQQVHTDVRDLKHTVTDIDGKIQKIDIESKMLNDGVALLKNNMSTIEHKISEETQSIKDILTVAQKELSTVEGELQRFEQHFNLYKNDLKAEELENFQYVIKMQEPRLPQPIAIGTDCATLYENDMRKNGIYRIQPDPLNDTLRFEVYCDMETDGGGWTVIQRREDGSEDFYRNWKAYKDGFGDLSGEFWLGLEYIYQLNQMGNKVIRFDMWDFEENYAFAEYRKFRLMNETAGYRIQVGRYNGTAGNAFHYSNYHLRHNNMKFSTFDNNDNPYGRNCPRLYQSGWWFHNCMIANLNGLYYSGHNGYYESHFKDGIMWQPWKTSLSLKKTEIKIRPENFGEGSTKIRLSG